MARPIKKEPDYVPLDTDLLSNRKIYQIKCKYGSDTFLLYTALLCDIYASGYYIMAYKEEREFAFLRKILQRYKASYPLERLYPARVYQSLQERGPIHNIPEEKRHTMSLFAHWRSPGHLPISESYRLTMVRQQAMAWLLRRYFDGLIAKEKA